MKKILLTIGAAMCIALAANAQERSDTTRTDQPSSQYRTEESGTQGETSTVEGKSGTQGQAWRDEDREAVSREDLPAGLLQTLEGDEYKGWESATIYRNRTSNEYMLELDDNGETRTFFFNAEGQPQDFNDRGAERAMDQHRNEDGQDQSDQYSAHDVETGGGREGQTSEQGNEDSASVSSSGVSSSSSGQTESSASGSVSADDDGVSAGVTTSTPTASAEVSTSQDPQWESSDKVKITTNQIPSAMLITLGDPMYKGWDKSNVYRNKSTNEYMIEINDGTSTRTYYFDQSGSARHYGHHNMDQSTGNQSTMDQSSGADQSSSSVSAEGDMNREGSVSYQSDKKTNSTSANEPTSTTSSGAVGTTGNDNSESYRSSTQGSVQTENQPPSNQWRTEDRVTVEMNDVPSGLRTTLSSDDRYRGWENSTIYQNRTSNDYMIEIRDGSNTNTYYFDSEGQPRENGDQSSDDNDQSSASGTGSIYPEEGDEEDADNGRYNWTDEQRTIIMGGDLPEGLVRTLSEDDKYKGWEGSKMYRNTSTDEYLIEIRDGDEVKTYYFDKDGNAIEVEKDGDQ